MKKINILLFALSTVLLGSITANAQECMNRQPQVQVESSFIAPGETAEFYILITNMDDPSCDPVTFSVSPWHSHKFAVELSPSHQIELAPGETDTVSADIWAVWALEDGVYELPFYVFSSAFPQPVQCTFYIVQQTIDPSCMNRQPQVQAHPALVAPGETAEIEIVITNTDDQSCAPQTYTVSPWYSHTWNVVCDPSHTVELAPGETGSIFADVWSVYGPMPPGTYEIPFYVFSGTNVPVQSAMYLQVVSD